MEDAHEVVYVQADFELGTAVNQNGEIAITLQFIHPDDSRSSLYIHGIETAQEMQRVLSILLPSVTFSSPVQCGEIAPTKQLN